MNNKRKYSGGTEKPGFSLIAGQNPSFSLQKPGFYTRLA